MEYRIIIFLLFLFFLWAFFSARIYRPFQSDNIFSWMSTITLIEFLYPLTFSFIFFLLLKYCRDNESYLLFSKEYFVLVLKKKNWCNILSIRFLVLPFLLVTTTICRDDLNKSLQFV